MAVDKSNTDLELSPLTVPPSTQVELPPGTMLSDTYEIVEQIALGGMAEVYRARNIHTDEPVAVKVVLPEFARDQTILALFRKEATTLSRLHHDAIVHYHLFTVERSMNRPYLVMEFVDGVHLGDFYKNNPLDAESVTQLMLRVSAGLAVAHDSGVIHRDLSPDNVILPDSDVRKTKIIDFGIAKAAAGEGTLLGGKFAGKYNFVSPEQLGLAGGEVTERSDIYSLGLIAAAAVLGRTLDMSGSHVQVLEKRRVIPNLDGVDPAVRPMIEAMLEPLPEDRPQNMREVMALWSAPPQPRPQQQPQTPPPQPENYGRTVVVADDPWGGAPTPHSQPPQQMPEFNPAPMPRSQPPRHTTPPWAGEATVVNVPAGQPPLNFDAPTQVPQSFDFSPPPGAEYAPPVDPQAFLAPKQPPQERPAPVPPAAPVTGDSESPFGPYVDKGDKFKLPPPVEKKPAKKGSPLPMVAAAAVVIVGGGLAFGFSQNWFAPPAGAPATGTSGTAVPSTDTPAAVAQPPAAAPSAPAETPRVPADAPTIGVAEGPKPAETATPANSTEVAAINPESLQPTSPTPVTPRIDTAAARVAWLDNYQLDKCEYVRATTVADNAMGIEAYGIAAQPFEKLAADFQRQAGFEPSLGVRLLRESQCSVADFLNGAKPVTAPGPTLSLAEDTLVNGGSLNGTLVGTAGWNTDLLLVDYAGGVQNISAFLQQQEQGQSSFTLPQMTTKSSDAVPLVLLAISSKGEPLTSPRINRTYVAGSILPGILQEIRSRPGDVAVNSRYFVVSGVAQ